VSVHFTSQSSAQIGEAAEKGAVLILPVGTVEEHGAHLPVGTDVVIAEEAAAAACKSLQGDPPALVLPAWWAGYSTAEMTRWPGTVRLDPMTLQNALKELCESLIGMGFAKLLIINSHGHHRGLLRVVARRVADSTSVYIAVTDVAAMAREAVQENRKSQPGGAIHGGEFETALMLHLRPDEVDMSKATAEDHFRYDSDFLGGDGFSGGSSVFWSTWGVQPSKTGIYGDPTVATAEMGRRVFEAMVGEYVAFIREFAKHGNR